MNYVEFTAGNTNYKLRLNTRGLITLEKDLGYNPIQLFGIGNKPVTPSVEDMLKVFKTALQPYHNTTEEDSYTRLQDRFCQQRERYIRHGRT